ncbi:MAG TPA: YqzG/YhdC family protein [Bacillales bacterium]|nr:YqzG/YhdC family protein [Bacillales bacterium]
MRKLFICLIAVFILSPSSIYPLNFANTSHAQQKPIPSYAKWGRLAMEKTHEKYPNAQIIDYLHIGRITGTQTSTEKFKLWLKDNQKEFGVFVDIEFDNKSENIIKINLKQTSK